MSETVTAAMGWSTKVNATEAGKEAAEAAWGRLSSPQPQLALVFGSSWFDQVPLLEGVRSVLGATPLVGESTAGEIVPGGPLSHSCVVMLLAGNALSCSIGVGTDIDRAPRAAGQQAASAAVREFHGSPRKGLLLLGDGLATSYADVVRGLQEVLGTSFLIVGGMAGDDSRYEQTYQYAQDAVVSKAVIGVLLGGPLTIGVGIEHGFAPISKPRRITRSHANVLFELDHQPAASVYEEYFGASLLQRIREEGTTRQHIAYPLGIQCESTDQWLLRNVVSFRPDGSLSCSGEISEGSWLQLMIGGRELALEAASRAAQSAIGLLNRIACVLVFVSVIRRKLFGAQHAAMEITRIREVIGPSVPLAGCYTYGEQAPLKIASSDEQTATQTGSVLVVAPGT